MKITKAVLEKELHRLEERLAEEKQLDTRCSLVGSIMTVKKLITWCDV